MPAGGVMLKPSSLTQLDRSSFSLLGKGKAG